MSFPGWLADRVILQPTRHAINVPGRQCTSFSHEGGVLEIWVHRVGRDVQQSPDLYVLEFPGTASRAEHQTDFVEDCWSQTCVEIWAVNPPGYGNSSGTASLAKMPAAARRALQEIRATAGDRPVVAAGGSLGSVSALYLAAYHRVDGLMVQNPPALREVILAQSAWWHFKWATRLIARQIPVKLDSLANARRAQVPAVFVTALKDRVVFPGIQRRIIDAYAGPSRTFSMPDADHDTALSDSQLEGLRHHTDWLYQVLGGASVPPG